MPGGRWLRCLVSHEGSGLTQGPLQWHWWWQGSAPLGSSVGTLLVQGIISSPRLPLVSVPTFPLILVIPNPISTDLIFTSKSWMNMLNIIIR